MLQDATKNNIDIYDSTHTINDKKLWTNIIISKNVQGIDVVFVPQLQVDDGGL